MVAPLTSLISPKTKFYLTSSCQEAFNHIKYLLCTASIVLPKVYLERVSGVLSSDVCWCMCYPKHLVRDVCSLWHIIQTNTRPISGPIPLLKKRPWPWYLRQNISTCSCPAHHVWSPSSVSTRLWNTSAPRGSTTLASYVKHYGRNHTTLHVSHCWQR